MHSDVNSAVSASDLVLEEVVGAGEYVESSTGRVLATEGMARLLALQIGRDTARLLACA